MRKIKELKIVKRRFLTAELSVNVTSIEQSILQFGLFNGHRSLTIKLGQTGELTNNYSILSNMTNEHVILDISNIHIAEHKQAIEQLINILSRRGYLQLITNDASTQLETERLNRISLYDPDLTKPFMLEHFDELIIPIKGFSSKSTDEYTKRLNQILSSIYNCLGVHRPLLYLQPHPTEGFNHKNLKTCIDLITLDSSFCLSIPYTIIT